METFFEKINENHNYVIIGFTIETLTKIDLEPKNVQLFFSKRRRNFLNRSWKKSWSAVSNQKNHIFRLVMFSG